MNRYDVHRRVLPHCTMAKNCCIRWASPKSTKSVRPQPRSLCRNAAAFRQQHTANFHRRYHVGGFTDLYGLNAKAGWILLNLQLKPTRKTKESEEFVNPDSALSVCSSKTRLGKCPTPPNLWNKAILKSICAFPPTARSQDGYYNVDVTVTVTAKLNAERTMFLNEVNPKRHLPSGKHP